MGEISSKISSRPLRAGRSVRPAAFASATRRRQASDATSQSKLSVWRASRSGTVRVSVIFAKLSREAFRPFSGVVVASSAAAKSDLSGAACSRRARFLWCREGWYVEVEPRPDPGDEGSIAALLTCRVGARRGAPSMCKTPAHAGFADRNMRAREGPNPLSWQDCPGRDRPMSARVEYTGM